MKLSQRHRRTAILCASLLGLAAAGGRTITRVAEAQSAGPVAAYGFDEGVGTIAADASGNGNPGTISGASWTTAGKFGGALRFNGTSAVVTVNHSASLNLTSGMTVEAWVEPAVAPSGWRTVLHKNVNRYYLMAGSTSANRPAIGGMFSSGNANLFGGTRLTANLWTHLAATFDGATVRLYVNGVQVATRAQATPLTTSTSSLQIGGSGYGEYFNGWLDEIRIYNRALSAAEIQADMQTAVGPTPPDVTPPSAPSNLVATTPGVTQASLSWTASTDDRGVTGYQVERCAGAGCGSFALIGSPTGTSYNDAGLAVSTTYSYRVRATDAAGNFSGYSNTATVTTPSPDLTPPTPPGNVIASATVPGQINVSWMAATDNVAVTGYLIDRCQGAGCANFGPVATSTTTSYANAGLAAGTTYGYRVTATDAAGNLSACSNTAYATTRSQVAGLVAAYSFDAGAGLIAADDSGNGNQGTIAGATWTPSGKFGNALVFNGSNAVVTIPYAAALDLSSQMTLEGWVKPSTAPTGWRTLLHKNTDRYYLMASSTNVNAPAVGGTFGSGNQNTYGTAQLAANVWKHLAATFDGTTLRLYVDGVQVGAQAQGTSLTASTGTLQIGGSVYGEYFDGTIDEIRIYNRALSPQEIQADMAAPVGGPRLVISEPAAGSTIPAGSVTVRYSAAGDLTGVDHVHFQLDSTSVVMDMDFDGTYVYSNVPVGAHTLNGWLVRADHSKIDGTDATVSFSTTVPDSVNPTVVVTAPASGATVSGVIALSADASDNVGIAGVQFQLDAASLGAEDTSAPYSMLLNTAIVANGPHTVTAIARDLAGNRTTSDPVPITTSNNGPTDPAQIGAWSAVQPWPMVAIHASLMPNGKVLAWDHYSGPTGVEVWDPLTGGFSFEPYTTANLFCAGVTTLADGRPILVGGHTAAYVGIADTTIFDPATQSLTRATPMAYARWYPTATTLPNGRILAVSGAINCPSCNSPGSDQPGIAAIPEIFDPVSNAWTQLPTAALSLPLYPHMFVLPDGRVVATSTQEDPIVSKVLDLTTNTWSTVDPVARDGGTAAMYLPGRIIMSGSARNPDYPVQSSAATTFVLDMTQPSPQWRQTAPMALARTQHTLTTLPDGTVLVTGGSGTSDVFNLGPAVMEAEVWSPSTETWRTLARMATPRVYHSIALLLPDARVLVAGGGRFGIDQLSGEIYFPPYLFTGPRPSITSAPGVAQYGAAFFTQTPDASRIASVSMIRIGSVTHAINMGQVFVPVTFSPAAGGLTVQAPANANIAPPGYYMLFLVDTNGVPSVAKMIQIPLP